jgi:glycosyltransferase involved in cell wall biosynthesis
MRLALLSPPGEGQLGVSLARGFVAEGHDVRFVSASLLTSDGRLMPRARRAGIDGSLSRPLARSAARRCGSPDAVLVIRGRFLRRRDVEQLGRSTGAPIVNYYPDNPLYGSLREPAFLRALPAYDLVVVWSARLADQLPDVGVSRTAVVPFGYDPDLYAPPPPGTVPRFDVAFVGSASPHRVRWLRELRGLRIALAGPRWRRLARGTPLAQDVLTGPRWGRSAARVYWSAHLGVNILDPQNLIGHNMRTWELPATGRASVVTHTADHEALFGSSGALLVERPEELRIAVERLLADPIERESIARAGREAVRQGTWRARARELAAAITVLT